MVKFGVRESQRPFILEAGLRVAGSPQGATITLDAVAHEAGVTKPGLMYHFPNREALMVALVEHAAAKLVEKMARLTDPGKATPSDRYRAYILSAADGENARAEWALWFQSSYWPELQAAWTRHLEPWLFLPHNMPPSRCARFAAARLAADGLWAAQASGVLAPTETERELIVAQLLELLGEGDQK